MSKFVFLVASFAAVATVVLADAIPDLKPADAVPDFDSVNIIPSFTKVDAAAKLYSADNDANSPPGVPNGFFPQGFAPFHMPSFPPIKILTPDDIKNLTPADGNTVVSGSSYSSSSSVETVNGVPVKKTSSGRAVTNNNGDVTDVSYGN